MSDERSEREKNRREGDRNQSEPNGTREWNALCGAQLELLVGIRGFSIKAFAARVGVTEKTYGNWRAARKAPKSEHRANIVNALAGVDDPIWDDPRFAELAVALGARRPPKDPPPVPPKPPWPWIVAGAGLLLLLVVGWKVWPQPDELVDVIPAATGPWRLVYSSGMVKDVTVKPRNECFSWNVGPRNVPTRHVFRAADGHSAVLVVSLDTATPDSPTGQLRVDRFNRDSSHPEPAWIDEAPRYGGETYAANTWSLQAVVFLDADGDGAQDVVVVGTHAWFPSVLAVFDATPARQRTYAHAGHITSVIALLPELVPPQTAGVSSLAVRGSGFALSVEFNDPPRCAGLVILPAGFASGANPVSDARYRHDTIPVLETAHYLRFLPSVCARAFPAQQNWPEALHYDGATQRLQTLTQEEPEGDGVIRYLDIQLHQVTIVPTDRFRHKYTQLQAQYHLPPLDGEAFAASVESVLVYDQGEWSGRRHKGAWQP